MLTVTTIAKKKYNLPGKPAPFTKGTTTLALGVGFGRDDYGYYSGANALPVFSLSMDHGIINNAGPGNIGIGGILAYTSATYNYSGGYYSNAYKETWANYFIGVRGTYHLTLLKDKNNKFDPYAGVSIGVRVETYNNNYNNNSTVTDKLKTTPYHFEGIFVGAKYNFTSAMGVYAEAGYDISLLRVGLNFNMGGNKGQVKADNKKVKETAAKEDKVDEDRDEDEKDDADKKKEEKKEEKPAKAKKAKKK